MARTPNEDRDASLDGRIAFRCTKGEEQGAAWLVDRSRAAVKSQFPDLPAVADAITIATVMRDLLKRELRAQGWPGLHGAEQTEVPPAAAPIQPPTIQAAVDTLTGVSVNMLRDAVTPPPAAEPAKPIPAPAKAKPAKDLDTDPDAVRALLEECAAAGLVMSELAKRSGIDRAKLSHFKNANPERGKLPTERLRALAAACRRWRDEQAQGAEKGGRR